MEIITIVLTRPMTCVGQGLNQYEPWGERLSLKVDRKTETENEEKLN